MNFDLTQDQKLLVDTAAAFVRKESPVTRLRAMRQDPVGYTKPVWKQMGELGWLGILLPESLGGFGGTFVDAALVLEKLGTTLVPEPYIASVVLAGDDDPGRRKRRRSRSAGSSRSWRATRRSRSRTPSARAASIRCGSVRARRKAAACTACAARRSSS